MIAVANALDAVSVGMIQLRGLPGSAGVPLAQLAHRQAVTHQISRIAAYRGTTDLSLVAFHTFHAVALALLAVPLTSLLLPTAVLLIDLDRTLVRLGPGGELLGLAPAAYPVDGSAEARARVVGAHLGAGLARLAPAYRNRVRGGTRTLAAAAWTCAASVTDAVAPPGADHLPSPPADDPPPAPASRALLELVTAAAGPQLRPPCPPATAAAPGSGRW